MAKHVRAVTTAATGEPIYVLDADGGQATIVGDERTLNAVRDSLVKDGAVERTVFDYGYFSE
jgi:hypothetical protein